MTYPARKMKFSINDLFSKCDQIRSFLRIWSHLLKKSLMENFIFCAISIKVFELRLLLVIYLMNQLYTMKKNSITLWNMMKNGYSKDEIFPTTSKTENFLSNFYYESVTQKPIEVKRKVSAKRVLWLFLTFFRCL